MESLKKISNLGSDLSDDKLRSIEGGKKAPNYSNTWWYKGLDGLGKVAEAGSSLWQIKYY